MTDGSEILPRVFPTVVHMLDDAVRAAPEATALTCGALRLSYAGFGWSVARFAAELLALGARGERVALVGGNSLDLPVAMFATHAAHAQVVPINPLYTERELEAILRDAEPHVLVCDAALAPTLEPLCKRLGIVHLLQLGDGRLCDTADAEADGADPAATLPQPLPAPDTLATLQYTGGTTGRAKGVNITHRQLAVNVSQREAALPTRLGDERILCVMPLFHVFAVAMGLHLAVHARGTLVILPRFQPEGLLETLERERITRLPAGPTIFIGLLAHERFARTDFRSLRSAWSGSAPLARDTLERWQARTGTPILEGFGQTEAGPVLSYQRPDGPQVPGSVGPALPLTEIEIVDVETGRQVLPTGQAGEIRARGPQIMSGYRNLPDETSVTLRDGWLYTGDIGELDRDGNLYIRDRKKDMVIVGGYNVYPREVDEVLFTHPDVREAATVGVPDPYYGEAVHSFVVLRDGASADADTLRAHCRAHLARYKLPSRITRVAALPRTPVGKVDRQALRAAAAAGGSG